MHGPTQTPRAGWIAGGDGEAYPPEPWQLGGELLLSVFRVDPARLPAEAHQHVPPSHRLLTLGGKLTVGVAAVGYTPGGVLTYDELLVSVAATRLASVITQIWVDSPASRTGGRELWGIPKHLAEFDRAPGHVTARGIAELEYTTGTKLLPGLRKLPLTTAQALDGHTMVATNMLLSRPRRLSARWSFTPDGPLAWLAGERPVASVALTEAAIAFGVRVRRT